MGAQMSYTKGAVCAVALYAAWFAFIVRPASRSAKLFGPRWLARFGASVLYRFGCWWLDFSIDTEEAIKKGYIDTSKQYLLIWHPHGAFTIAALYFFGYFAATSSIFPDNRLYCSVADLLLKIPGLAEYLMLAGARSVDSKTVGRVLQAGKSTAIQPGGIYEQVHTDHTKEVLYFPARLGFIRLAIKNGVPLLPIYAFGENQLFDTSDWMRSINIWLYRKFGMGNLFLHGRFGLPVTPLVPNPLLLPNPGRGLHLRWGEPVEVGAPDPDPSDEKIQEVYTRYCASLQKVFNEHKDKCLPPKVAAKGLEIVIRK